MWQRIQTIFLLIAAITSISYLFVPLVSYPNGTEWYAKDDMIAASIAIATGLISMFAIIQYKNRRLQMRLSVISILLALALIITVVYATLDFLAPSKDLIGNKHYEFIIGIPFVVILALFFARRNIKKDEDLVKSMDRFR